MGVLGVDMVNLRRRRNEEGERSREGEVSRVSRLGGGECDRGFGGTKSNRGVEHRVIGGCREVNQGGTWIVKESYNVTSGGVGRLIIGPSHQEPSK